MGMTGEQAYVLAKKLIEAGGGGGDTVDAYTKTQTDNLLIKKVDKEAGKGLFSGSYNDLKDAPSIPSKTSELQNDSGYLTEHQDLSGYATEQWVGEQGYLTEHQDLTQITEDIKNINDSLEIKNAIGTSFELITSQGGIRTNKILGNTHKSDDGVITSCGDSGSIEIKEHGKNLIPFPYYSGTSLVHNGITFTANEDGSVTANGTATSNAFFRFANKNMYSLENGKTYAISRGKTKDIYMFAQNSSGDFVVLKVEESAKFTCNDTWRYIGCYVPKDTTVTNETIYPMLVEVNEDGTYPTEYEPYKSSISTIPLSEPLRAIGDIKDEITYQDGKWGVLRRIKKLVADTPTKINPSGALIGTTYDILANFGFEAQDSYNVVNKISDISKHIFRNFQSINTWNKDECGAFISLSGSTSARLSSSICGSTLDEVKAYFKNNPLIGQYVLATPVFEPFADQTLPYLSTYDGTTNISNDDALSAEMTVKYPTTDASGVGSRNESRIAELAKNGETLTHDVAAIKNALGDLTFSVSGTTLSITDGTNTWTLEAHS